MRCFTQDRMISASQLIIEKNTKLFLKAKSRNHSQDISN